MQPYFYIIQYSITGQYYAGVQFRKSAHPTNILKNYLTSSSIVKYLIALHGVDKWEVRKIRLFSDRKTVEDYEHRFLTRVDAKNNPRFINEANGGWTHFPQNRIGKIDSETTRRKRSEATQKVIQARGHGLRQGSKHSEETKRQMSLSRTGHRFSEESKLKMKMSAIGKPGTRIGAKNSPEAIAKMKATKLRRKLERLNTASIQTNNNHPSS